MRKVYSSRKAFYTLRPPLCFLNKLSVLRLSMVVFFTLLCNGQMQAQFLTRVLAPDDHIGNHIPWYMPDRTVIVDAPYIDVERVLEQDRINKREMPRVGIPQEVNYSLKDGQFYFSDKYTIWNFTLRSRGAKATSIRLDNSRLPEDAVMFVYNEENRFVSSPLSHKDFKEGMFRSDYMNGDQITLSVYIPSVDLALFQMNVTTFDHSIIRFRAFDGDFENSQPCNVNVACPAGNGWDCEIDAVCKIIHSDIGSCTGTLINNGCCDFRGYILTANHCLLNQSGLLADIEDYTFRFNYQSPQCTPNGETTPGQWIIYTGSELRARWNGTDFGLLELEDDLDSNLGDIAFAGWNRTPATPNSSTYLHHPKGDTKKITFDAGACTISGNFFEFELTPGTNGDFGVLEPGSSGCAQFNNNRHIVGQHFGGTPRELLCTTTSSTNTNGRFEISWTGNGTNATRLNNWLGGSGNPTQIDCMRMPEITGEETICSQSQTYTYELVDMPCPRNITWSVSPSNLFSSATSGTGTTANLQVNNGNAQKLATLTYQLTSAGCANTTMQKEIWIGKPTFEVNSDFFVCVDDVHTAFVVNNSLADIGTLQWTRTGVVQLLGSTSPYNMRYKATTNGTGTICASLTNECGTQQWCNLVYAHPSNCGGGFKQDIHTKVLEEEILIYPNPSSNWITVQLSQKVNGFIKVVDVRGKEVYQTSIEGKSTSIDLSTYPKGMYFFQLTFANQTFTKKIIKS